ncbi:hypothetical protein P4S68_11410 [Pseudoalteromonas sp. Hal099]
MISVTLNERHGPCQVMIAFEASSVGRTIAAAAAGRKAAEAQGLSTAQVYPQA